MSTTHADVLVIGSGMGGGAVSKRLSDAGIKVVCLEQGDWLRSPSDYSHELDTWELEKLRGWAYNPNDRRLDEDYPISGHIRPFLFNAVGLVIETGIVAVAKYGFEYTSLAVLNILTFVGIGIGTVFRFWAYRTHVFKKEVPAAPAGEEHPAEAPAPQAAQAEAPSTTPTPANAAPPAAATTVEGPKVDEDGQDDLNDELVEIELDQILRLHERVRR